MRKKVLSLAKWALLAVYLALVIFHAFLLRYCISSIITTFLFYLSIILIIYLIFNYFIRKKTGKKEQIKNCRFSLIFSFILLFIVELFLKYAIGVHMNYSEKNGEFYYRSQYIPVYSIISKKGILIIKNNLWVLKNRSNISRIDLKPEFEYKHIYNSQGFRDREFGTGRDSNEYRIIGVGDSFTEGIGTHQDSTWLKFLELKLNAGSTKYYFTTLNAGFAGSDPILEYKLLKDEIINYNPDLIVLSINKSDIDDIMIRGGMERFQLDGSLRFRKGPSWEYIYAMSFIFRHFIHDILHYNYWLMKNADYTDEQNRSVALIYNILKDIQIFAKQNRAELLVVFAPHYYELLDRKNYLSALTDSISHTDVKFADLYEYYNEKVLFTPDNIFEYYWKKDYHHTVKGYAMYADGVYDAIKRIFPSINEN